MSKLTSAINFMVCSKSSGGFTRETDDKVRAYLNVWTRRTQLTDDRFVFQRRVGTPHQVQYAIRTALYRQVQEAHQLRRVAIDLNDVVGELDRMAGGEANTINAINGGNQTQQVGERTGGTIIVLSARALTF